MVVAANEAADIEGAGQKYHTESSVIAAERAVETVIRGSGAEIRSL
jgi:hypothetical protein